MVSFRPTIGETCQALWEPLAFLSLLICSRRSSVSKTDGLFPLRLSRRESLSPQAVGVLPKTQNQAKKTQQRSPLLPLAVVSAVPLAGSLGDRQARYFPSLAARSLQTVLAVEVASRQAAIARKHSPAYCRHGEGKSQLGSGPNSGRAIREAGDLCFTTNRTCLLAGGAQPPRSKADFVSALADLCSQSRSGDRHQRLSGRDHGSLPNPVRVADHGDRQSPDSALQRYPTSYSGVDPTAVSRGRSQGPFVSISH